MNPICSYKMYLKLLLFFSIVINVLCDDNLLIETNDGIVQGKFLEILSGKMIRAFMGIPYAEAPVGNLRFKAPIPKIKWNGIKNVTKMHPECPQINFLIGSKIKTGEEDCLFLNVYTPTKLNSKKFPVMFWIHQGGFYIGSGNYETFQPDLLLENEDIILVTINYRLGALGFLVTDDDTVKGNNGLKDQVLALKWVKKNIAKFGGDPDNVTIFGCSAGSTSVTLHLTSPLSKGLFHSAIAQSGSAHCDWILRTKSEQISISKKFADLLNCPTNSGKEMISCLQKIDEEELINKQNMLFEWEVDPMIIFFPVIENNHSDAFMSEDPKKIIKSGEASDVPLIIGTNVHEGGFRSMLYLLKPETLKIFDENFEKLMKISLFFNKTFPKQNEIIKDVKKFYLKDKNMENADHDDILNMYSDVWFTSCIDTTLRLFKKYNKHSIYNYLFGFNGRFGLMKKVFTEEDYHVCHTDELPYLLPGNLIPVNYKNLTKSEKKMSETLTTLWINFAKTKKPFTPNVEWESIKSDDHEYLYIGNKIEMRNKMFNNRIKFWRKINKINDAKEDL